MMGESSAAHHALESAGVAPGDRNTLNMLRNPARRPAAPREPPDPELLTLVPPRPRTRPQCFLCELEERQILESERDAELLCQVAALLARGHIPPTALQDLRLGRLTALTKPDGRVRGIVVSVLRRLVVRTIAKQCSGGRRSHGPVPVRVEDTGWLRKCVTRLSNGH